MMFKELRWWSRVFTRIVIIGVLCVISIALVVGNYLYSFILTQSQYSIYDLPLALPSVIVDRNGEELYSFFNEKRTLVSYEQIAPSMINALISAEDKDFWSNDGFDPKAIVRSSLITLQDRWNNGFLGYSQGASTLTQQIIKNTIGGKEKELTRKLNEIVQAWLLTYNTYAINKELLDSGEAWTKTKQDIIEYYLNSMFFGNNAYGIAEAADLYFGVSPQDLTIQQSAILASIPKSPYYLDPYRFPENLLGFWEISIDGQPPQIIDSKKYGELFKKVVLNKRFGSTSGLLFERLPLFSGSTELENGEKHNRLIEYHLGRKDYVIQRLREDNHISEKDARLAMITPVKIKEKPTVRHNMKAPHFVNYIKNEILKNPEINISEHGLYQGGYTIHTTLDLAVQENVEAIVSGHNYEAYLLGAQNRGVLVSDMKDGAIIAYIGSKGFYNTVIDGQVDMVSNARQTGSALKPLIYAYMLSQYPIGIDFRIRDSRTNFGGYTPRNADGRYMGNIRLKNALAHSRNIPAIKVFNAMGGVDTYIGFFQDLGMKNLNPDGGYGLPMALGTAPMSMIDLAQGYTHLSDQEEAGTIHGVVSVEDRHGMMIYEYENLESERKIPLGVSKLITNILSKPENFPAYFRKTASALDCTACASKTGTTNVNKNGRSYPRDGRLVTYNPDVLITMWAGNTDASPMYPSTYGYQLHTTLRDDILIYLLENGYTDLENNWNYPEDQTKFVAGQGEMYAFPTYDSIPQGVKNLL